MAAEIVGYIFLSLAGLFVSCVVCKEAGCCEGNHCPSPPPKSGSGSAPRHVAALIGNQPLAGTTFRGRMNEAQLAEEQRVAEDRAAARVNGSTPYVSRV